MSRNNEKTYALPIERPPYRKLRVFAFDPSLSTQLENAVLNNVTLHVPWECDSQSGKNILEAGPVGEYLEVIDFDPASDCFYAPVDLNDPYLLAQDGLSPSEANPQFHQQMVYAVAMTTIRNFEKALGRPAFWSPRAWAEIRHLARDEDGDGRVDRPRDYVQRLRIYPHALREANAYYSPQKKALLLGYFPATSEDARDHLPGGTVFTCLSHDIVAHETTHALLDGMHRRFNESSNPDVLAFHEAFADIVALFQHFSFPEILRHQIARTRGDLSSENLLAQLAQEFGKAIGSHGSLRDALGGKNPQTGRWERSAPDPEAMNQIFEPHARGSLLVAAVFDAFVSIYQTRSADLLRIATNGTGILPAGELHPDLVGRLAQEASKTAGHVLTMCIRALDYCPPVDIDFGDYLRALITADFDLVPNDDLGYRIAVIEAFRRRGIYPRDMRSLSEKSLIWETPSDENYRPRFMTMLEQYREEIRRWGLNSDRRAMYEQLTQIRGRLHQDIEKTYSAGQEQGVHPEGHQGRKARANRELLENLVIEDAKRFEVHSLRPVRRVGPDGQLLTDVVIEITQWKPGYLDAEVQEQVENGALHPVPHMDFPFRGGGTIIVDLDTMRVRYSIYKRLASKSRLGRQRKFYSGAVGASLRAMYFGGLEDREEPFALLHRSTAEENLAWLD